MKSNTDMLRGAIALVAAAATAGLGCAAARKPPAAPAVAPASREPGELQGALRRDHDGWMFAHLEGTPARIGFQHGYLFADEIAAVVAAMRATVPTETESSWELYRQTAQR